MHNIPFLSNILLAPKIKSFKELYPQLKISIESKVRRAGLKRGLLQVAIRHDRQLGDRLCYEEISMVHVPPVCASGYIVTGESNQT
ncbi:hypothetical protein BTJ40_10875 [Microbulbifer sp. A4B17]|nr:hypothetical protein BTJ40_10875 [Microbulbifer sp. A4B17]